MWLCGDKVAKMFELTLSQYWPDEGYLICWQSIPRLSSVWTRQSLRGRWVILFCEMSSVRKLCMSHNVSGNSVSLLSMALSVCNACSLPMESGSFLILLWSTFSTCRLWRLPISAGKWLSSFEWMSRICEHKISNLKFVSIGLQLKCCCST